MASATTDSKFGLPVVEIGFTCVHYERPGPGLNHLHQHSPPEVGFLTMMDRGNEEDYMLGARNQANPLLCLPNSSYLSIFFISNIARSSTADNYPLTISLQITYPKIFQDLINILYGTSSVSQLSVKLHDRIRNLHLPNSPTRMCSNDSITHSNRLRDSC